MSDVYDYLISTLKLNKVQYCENYNNLPTFPAITHLKIIFICPSCVYQLKFHFVSCLKPEITYS